MEEKNMNKKKKRDGLEEKGENVGFSTKKRKKFFFSRVWSG